MDRRSGRFGFSAANLVVDSPAIAPSLLVVEVLVNQAPTVGLQEPFAGQRVMEGDSIRATATYSDDLDALSDIVLSWRVLDQGNVVLLAGNEPVFNITDLTAGFYIVEVTATDSFGEKTSATVVQTPFSTRTTIGPRPVLLTHGSTRTRASPAGQTSTTRTMTTMDSAMSGMRSRSTRVLKSTRMGILNPMFWTAPRGTRAG